MEEDGLLNKNKWGGKVYINAPAGGKGAETLQVRPWAGGAGMGFWEEKGGRQQEFVVGLRDHRCETQC